MRLPPVRHSVHQHRRKGKVVSTYKRGDRKPKPETPVLKGKKTVPIKKIHPQTPSGRLTSNLCTLSKGQTLLWEGPYGSERIITGTVSPKMKPHLCPTCWKTVGADEKAVMTQDYFPFRHHMVIKNIFHYNHFPFPLDNLIETEKAIDKYMKSPKTEHSDHSIYDLDQDVITGKFKDLIKFKSPKPLPKPHWRQNWEERFMLIRDINVPKVWNELRYKNALTETQKTGSIPPIDVAWNENTKTWEIQDGIHRTNATWNLGFSAIPVLMTKEDAKIYDNQS